MSAPPKPPPRAAVEADLFGAVFVLAQHLGRRTDAALAPLDLTSRQWLLLAVLSKAFPEGPPTLTAAAARYGSSRQNVKQIALQLQDRGYLEVVGDPDDRRASRLRLTGKVALFDRPDTIARQEALFREVFGSFPTTDLRTLHAFVRRWIGALEDLGT